MRPTDRTRFFAGREEVAGREMIVRYRIVPGSKRDMAGKKLSLEEAAIGIAMVSSTRVKTAPPFEDAARSGGATARVVSWEDNGFVEIAFPLALVSAREDLSQVMSVIVAAADYNYADELWIEDVEFPAELVSRFKGPRFGTGGVRQKLGVQDRPLLGVVVRPRWGSLDSRSVEAYRDALLGGVDCLVDDLLMNDPESDMGLEARVGRLVALAREVTEKTGSKKTYIVNVGAAPYRAVRLGIVAVKAGVAALLVNGFVMGLGTLQEFVERVNETVPVFTSNLGSGIMSRSRVIEGQARTTGLSETVIAKLSRLAGADAVHAGTSGSECYGEEAWTAATRALRAGMHGLKPCLAVAEGDLTIATLWANIRDLGRDTMIEATSGILGYPGGPRDGATAFLELMRCLDDSMTDEQAHQKIVTEAKRTPLLRAGLEQYGYKPRNHEDK